MRNKRLISVFNKDFCAQETVYKINLFVISYVRGYPSLRLLVQLIKSKKLNIYFEKCLNFFINYLEQRTAFGGTRNTIIKCQYDKAMEIMQALMMNAD